MDPSPLRSHALAAVALAALLGLACGAWVITHDATFVARDTAFTWLAAEHAADAMLGRVAYADGPLGWPLQDAAANSDVVVAQGLLGLPIRSLDPLLQSDLVSLLGLFLTALALHRVAHALTGPGPHTWLAAVIGAFGPIQMSHLQHINLVHHEWTALAALACGAGLQRRSPALTAAAGLFTAVSWTFGVYLGLHAAFAVVAVAGVAALFRLGDRRSWASLGLGLAGALALALALTGPWRDAADRYHVRVEAQELRDTSWHLGATLAPDPAVLLHAPVRALWPFEPLPTQRTNPPNPGYTVTLLAGIGAILAARRRLGWAWVAVAGLGLGAAALALGPDLIWLEPKPGWPGPWRIARWIPGLDGLRAPARWLALSFGCLGLFAAIGLRELAARVGRARLPALATVFALVLGETPGPRVAPFASATFEPVYAELDAIQAEGAIYDEALRHDADCGGRGGRALRAAMFHQRPLIGGSYARRFSALDATNRVAGSWPSPDAVALFRASGVVAVLEHPPLQPLPDLPGVSCHEAEGHRICEVAGATTRQPLPFRSRRIADAAEQRDPALRVGADDIPTERPRRRPNRGTP